MLSFRHARSHLLWVEHAQLTSTLAQTGLLSVLHRLQHLLPVGTLRHMQSMNSLHHCILASLYCVVDNLEGISPSLSAVFLSS